MYDLFFVLVLVLPLSLLLSVDRKAGRPYRCCQGRSAVGETEPEGRQSPGRSSRSSHIGPRGRRGTPADILADVGQG